MVQISFGGLTFGAPQDGALGEVKMFALTVAGAVTKATLQARGWAICDGTTAATQGVTSPTITAVTPNLENKFIRGSDDEASGATGGSDTHNHKWYDDSGAPTNYQSFWSDGNNISLATVDVTGGGDTTVWNLEGENNDAYTDKIDTKPPYYELVFFIKVRI